MACVPLSTVRSAKRSLPVATSKWKSKSWPTSTSGSGSGGVFGVTADKQLPAFGPNLREADRPAQEPNTPQGANSGHHSGSVTLGDFIAVARRSRETPRPLPLRRSGRRSDVHEAQWPALASASSACPAPSGLPKTGPQSIMPSSSPSSRRLSGSGAWQSTPRP